MAFYYQKAKLDAFPLMGTVANLDESLAIESTKKLTFSNTSYRKIQRRISALK